MMPKKEQLIQQLNDVALFLRILGENEFKVRAYDKAVTLLETDQSDLEAIASGKIKLPGIGEGLKSEIKSFLSLGEMTSFTELKKKIPAGVLELMEVPGLGPKKAAQLVETLGISSVGELEYCCKENRLVTVKGFGEAQQTKILKSIEEMKSRVGKLRLENVLEWIKTFEEKYFKVFKNSKCIQIGQLGRKLDIIDQIDLVLTGINDEKKLASFLKKNKFTDVLENGLKFKVKIIKDLEYTPGLKDFSDEINEANKEKFQNWEPTWLEPEWFDKKRTPNSKTYRIKKAGKVKGFFHCHTTSSDGQHSLEEMVKEAEQLGFEYIGISDHSKSAFYAQGLKDEQVLIQAEKVKKLQKNSKIKIFHGIESDILQDGELDYSEKILKGFDFVIGSIHSRFQMDKEAMTNRLLKAISHPKMTMWGHPTGRLLLSRKGYEADWDKCFQSLKKHEVVLELNANPQRLDSDWRWGESIEKHGLMISINPDAHSIFGIPDVEFGEWMAEKMMIPSQQILNLKSLDEIEEYLCQKNQK